MQMDMDTEFEKSGESYNNGQDSKLEIKDEICKYQENTRRSQEDGWFYSDGDEVI